MASRMVRPGADADPVGDVASKPRPDGEAFSIRRAGDYLGLGGEAGDWNKTQEKDD
jgi:hypothetical protein